MDAISKPRGLGWSMREFQKPAWRSWNQELVRNTIRGRCLTHNGGCQILPRRPKPERNIRFERGKSSWREAP